ncbi:hypothetical protein MJT46_017462 [Ovis ammon polii x Ovis aries]|nr:hypothetical protein MJT46_017462 [Ovis ammon polii x Ovis aries]
MPAFETRTDSPGETPKYPKMHVSTGEESSGFGPDSTQGLRPRHRRERNPERPPRNSHGDWPFLRPPERVPEVPVPRIDSHHVCMLDSPLAKPRGKASWESVVGKTRGKTIDPLIHAVDCVTLLLLLWRKAQVHAPIRDEDDSPGETPDVPQDPCQHWRGILRFQPRLHTRSYAPTSTGEESREAPDELAWGLAFPEATRAGP